MLILMVFIKLYFVIFKAVVELFLILDIFFLTLKFIVNVFFFLLNMKAKYDQLHNCGPHKHKVEPI